VFDRSYVYDDHREHRRNRRIAISRCTFFGRSAVRPIGVGYSLSRDVRYRVCRYLSMYVFGRSDIRVAAIHVDDRDTRTFRPKRCIRDFSSYLSPNTRRPSGSLVSLTYFLRVDDGRRVFVISQCAYVAMYVGIRVRYRYLSMYVFGRSAVRS